MKKVCILKYSFHTIGGTEHVAVKLANELSKSMEVHLVSIIDNPNISFFDLNENVHYKTILQGNIKIRTAILLGIRKLREYLVNNNIDVVIGIGVPTNIFVVLSTICLKVKGIVCDHMALANDYGNFSYRIQRWIGAKFANKIIVLTEENLKGYLKKYRIPNSRIDYIYNWIDFEYNKSSSSNSKKHIVTVGRFAYEKGYDYLIKIAEKVLSQHSDWVWDICGEGDSQIKDQLENFIQKNQLEEKLILHGNVKDMSKIYSDSSIYVMTSRFEGLPLVLLEAKQYNLPIISFKCPTGPAEIVRDGENGYLIDCFDTEIMTEKLNFLIEDSRVRLEFSNKSHLDIEKFSKENILKKWYDLIENI